MAPSTSSLPAPAAAHFAHAVQQHIAGHDTEAIRSYGRALAAVFLGDGEPREAGTRRRLPGVVREAMLLVAGAHVLARALALHELADGRDEQLLL